MEIGLKISRSLLCLDIFLLDIWPMIFQRCPLAQRQSCAKEHASFSRLYTTALEVVVWGVSYRVSAHGGTTAPIQAPFPPQRSVPQLTPTLFVLPMENTFLSCSYET